MDENGFATDLIAACHISIQLNVIILALLNFIECGSNRVRQKNIVLHEIIDDGPDRRGV